MLIFSASFQFYRMIPEGNPLGSESKRCLPSPATHPDMQSLMSKKLVTLPICACHPCAGAMLIFSISFQFYRMIPKGNPLGSESKRCLPSPATHPDMQSLMSKKLVTLLDLCVSSLRRGHANLLYIVPILSDDPQRESTGQGVKKVLTLHPSIHPDMQSLTSKKLITLLDLCVSSLRRGHANLLCIVPILSDDPQRECTGQ